MIWVIVMARQIKCPFCDTAFAVRSDISDLEAAVWLETEHVPMHAEIIERAAYEPSPALDCARCQRYAAARMSHTDPLHRPCYSPDCTCKCSYPARQREDA